jgi:hypothetical protein
MKLVRAIFPVLVPIAGLALILGTCTQGSSFTDGSQSLRPSDFVQLRPIEAQRFDDDGHYFESAEFVDTDVTIRYRFYNTLEDLQAEANRSPTLRDLGGVVGFANSRRSLTGERTCTIHVLNPAIYYDPDTIGHEVTHCFYGNFHIKQDAARNEAD